MYTAQCFNGYAHTTMHVVLYSYMMYNVHVYVHIHFCGTTHTCLYEIPPSSHPGYMPDYYSCCGDNCKAPTV